MKRLGWQRFFLAALLGIAAMGCDDLGAVDEGDDDDDVIEGVECMAELSATGTLVPPGTPPAAEDGCIPLGTWTVQIAMVDPGDCGDVPFLPEYVYEVTGVEGDGYTYTYVGDPTNENVYMKVTQSGPGDCNANFEHYSADGMSLMLVKPFERDLVLSGSAYYETYTEPAIEL